VGLVALSFTSLGNPSKSTKTKRRHEPQASNALGSLSNPIPLGKSVPVGAGWRLRVVSIDRNAHALDYFTNRARRVPPRARDIVILVAVKYSGGGQGSLGDVLGRLYAVGRHRAPYALTSGLNGCGPGEAPLTPPDLQTEAGDVFSGRSLQGHVCFEIAANDASTLRMYVERPINYSQIKSLENALNAKPKVVWFRLRR
jgi:hypothetical protein